MNRTTVMILVGFAAILIAFFFIYQSQPTLQKTATSSDTDSSKSSPTAKPTISSSSAAKTDDNIATQSAVIKTAKGDITVALYLNDAPKTLENFIKKAENGFYNNLTFHRVEDWVIQGGDPLGNGTGGADMPTELNDRPFVVGSLGVARGQDIKISNDSQFFITKTEASWLNGQYTNFGIVTKGLDVVNKIEIGDKILEIAIE